MKKSILPIRTVHFRPVHFSLIELLIVIAIIAILAGMLLPALSNARSLAKGTQCINLQKQIYTSLMNYADDNREYAVLLYGSGYNVPNSKAGSWAKYLFILGYMDPSKDLSGWNAYRINNLLCPAIKSFTPEDSDGDRRHYGMIAWANRNANWLYRFAYDEDSSLTNGFIPIYKLVQKPSEIGHVTCTWEGANKRQWMYTSLKKESSGQILPANSTAAGFIPAHSRRSNILMVAGNVRQVSLSEMAAMGHTKRKWTEYPFSYLRYYVNEPR